MRGGGFGVVNDYDHDDHRWYQCGDDVVNGNAVSIAMMSIMAMITINCNVLKCGGGAFEGGAIVWRC